MPRPEPPSSSWTALQRMIGRYVPQDARALLNDWSRYGYVGRFATWEEAAAHASALEPDAMLARTAAATQAVRDGVTAYEQDSMPMIPPAEALHILDTVRAAATGRRSVHVLDFGGGLGSKSYWCRRALSAGVRLQWTVVELEDHAAHGRAHFASDDLIFTTRIEEAAQRAPVDVVLCCSVLQYLKDASQVLAALAAIGARFIVLDRTPYATRGEPEIVLQRIPSKIYPATFVSWLLSERAICDALASRYTLLRRFEYPRVYSRRASFVGHVFRRIEAQYS